MKVIFIGAANPESIRMIAAVQRVTPNFEALGFIDNDPAKAGTSFYGLPVLGGSESIPDLLGDDVRYVNLITGSTKARYETTLDAVAKGAILTNFIHPSVDLTMTGWGAGNYVQESVITQAEVRVGDNSSLGMGTVVGHETRIGNSVFIAGAVSVAGCCDIDDGTLIGTNATILPRTKIGAWSTIGAGAVVTKDIPPHSVAVGNPARVIRTVDIPYKNGAVAQ